MKGNVDTPISELAISQKAKKMLCGASITTSRILLEKFSPRRLMGYVPGLSANDLHTLGAELRKISKKQANVSGWSRANVKATLRVKIEGEQEGPLGFPHNTDQGVINRFIHSATTGKHYKKSRWRRRL